MTPSGLRIASAATATSPSMRFAQRGRQACAKARDLKLVQLYSKNMLTAIWGITCDGLLRPAMEISTPAMMPICSVGLYSMAGATQKTEPSMSAIAPGTP